MDSMLWLIKNIHLVTDTNFNKMVDAFSEISKKNEFLHARHGSDVALAALDRVKEA